MMAELEAGGKLTLTSAPSAGRFSHDARTLYDDPSGEFYMPRLTISDSEEDLDVDDDSDINSLR